MSRLKEGIERLGISGIAILRPQGWGVISPGAPIDPTYIRTRRLHGQALERFPRLHSFLLRFMPGITPGEPMEGGDISVVDGTDEYSDSVII